MSPHQRSGPPVQPGVNLLPPEVHQRRAARRMRSWLVLAVAVVVALVVGGVVWATGEVEAAEERLQASKDEHERLKTEEALYWEVPIVLAELSNAENADTLSMWREIIWEPYMHEIIAVLPDDVVYERFAVQTPGATDGMLAPGHPLETTSYAWIQFEGHTEVRPDVAAWIEAIEGIEGFEHAWVDFVTLEGDAEDEGDVVGYHFQGDIDLNADALSGRFLPEDAFAEEDSENAENTDPEGPQDPESEDGDAGEEGEE